MVNCQKIMEDYFKHSKKLDLKTLKFYRIDLNQYFGFADMDFDTAINRNTADCYEAYVLNKFKTATAKRKIASLKAFFGYLKERGYVQQNIFDEIHIVMPKRKYERPVSMSEIDKLMSVMYEHLEQAESEYGQKSSLRDIAVIKLLLSTGMRISEVCGLKDEDVNLQIGRVYIRTKSLYERTLIIDDSDTVEFLKMYRKYYAECIVTSGSFFINRDNNALSEQSIRKMIRKYARNAGIKANLTPNTFRQLYISKLLENGIDAKTVQNIAGQRYIETTIGYDVKELNNKVFVSKTIIN